MKAIANYPEYYNYFIQLIESDNIVEALQNSFASDYAFLKTISEAKEAFQYAADKWTIKQVVMHAVDCERIMMYRALCIARGDVNTLPGFDENAYAIADETNRRSLHSIVEEWKTVRDAMISLYASFSEQQLAKTGTANGKQTQVAAIAFFAAGHTKHHIKVIRERYL